MASTHAVWLRRFLNDMDLDLVNGSIQMYCDNQAAISLINSGTNSSKGKHIEIQYHYIRDIMKNRKINVTYIPTTDIIADPLTK